MAIVYVDAQKPGGNINLAGSSTDAIFTSLPTDNKTITADRVDATDYDTADFSQLSAGLTIKLNSFDNFNTTSYALSSPTQTNVRGTLVGFENYVFSGGMDKIDLSVVSASYSISFNIHTGALTVSNGQGGGFNSTVLGIENVTLGSGNDTLYGSVVNTASGLNASQYIASYDGKAGVDTLNYSDLQSVGGILANLGTNSITFQATSTVTNTHNLANFEKIVGSANNDTFLVNNFSTVVGPDMYKVNNYKIDGGAGSNTLDFSPMNSITYDLYQASHTSNNNVVNIQNLRGTVGNDNLTGNEYDNIFYATKGNDIYNGAPNIPGYPGGFNTVDYSGINGAVTFSLYNNSALGNNLNTQFLNINKIIGSNNADVFLASNNNLDGYQIDGNGGDDTLSFSAATSSVTYSLNSSNVINTENIQGSSFDDTFRATTFDASTYRVDGFKNIDGLGGTNTLDFSFGSANSINFSLSDASIMSTVSHIQNLIGTDGHDSLIGNADNNIFYATYAYGGSDTYDGNAGIDTLNYIGGGFGFSSWHIVANLTSSTAFDVTASCGNAYQYASAVNVEKISATNYNDTFIFSDPSAISSYQLDGQGGTDTIQFNTTSEITFNLASSQYTNIENLQSGSGVENLTGNDLNNTFIFNTLNNSGIDAYNGAGGENTLDLSSLNLDSLIDLRMGVLATDSNHDGIFDGNEVQATLANFQKIISGNGNDSITANTDTNSITGGLGADQFVFSDNAIGNTHTITDFNPGQNDKLVLQNATLQDVTITSNGNNCLVDVNYGTDVLHVNLQNINVIDPSHDIIFI